MPYNVRSQCPACNGGDEFIIGLWPNHLGVYVCADCKAVINIPLETGECKCGYHPAVSEFYDYAYSIPYLGGKSLGELEPGPICPRCCNENLTFETMCHFNVGRLGTTEDETRPWIGKDYLEKAIFCFALISVCAQFDLDIDELLEYYNLDLPKSLLPGRRISFPIMMDIRSHLIANVLYGDTSIRTTPKMQEAVEKEFGVTLQDLESKKEQKSWWQFWK